MKCFLAVDIGASSGRHIVGYVENGRMKMREIYRFPQWYEDAGRQAVLGHRRPVPGSPWQG